MPFVNGFFFPSIADFYHINFHIVYLTRLYVNEMILCLLYLDGQKNDWILLCGIDGMRKIIRSYIHILFSSSN